MTDLKQTAERISTERLTVQLDASQTTALMLDSVIDRCRKDASAAEAQVLRLTEENEALRKGTEPELSCPHLDAFIAATNPPADVIDEIEAARNINSQLRYGLWHEKVRAEAAEARVKELEEGALLLLSEIDAPNGFDWLIRASQRLRTALKGGSNG